MKLFKNGLVVIVAGVFLISCSSKKKEYEHDFVGGHRPLDKFAGPVPGSVEDFKKSAANTIHFDFNSSNIRADASEILKKQADWLKKYPSVDLLIEGHCDKRGTVEYNMGLGSRRANAARDFLINMGIEKYRLRTVSYGKSRLIGEGDSPEVQQENRRAVSVIE